LPSGVRLMHIAVEWRVLFSCRNELKGSRETTVSVGSSGERNSVRYGCWSLTD